MCCFGDSLHLTQRRTGSTWRSRAVALAVVVTSEELLDAAVRTSEQLSQIDALCRLVMVDTDVDGDQ